MRASVAVIFTCFNRKEKTVACLLSLKKQNNMPAFDLYICDDASTDGTVEAIYSIYPDANILVGTGNLFWSRGMHMAMSAAIIHGYDYYLMINDDVEFRPSMWSSMIQAYIENRECGVTGCILAKSTQQLSYGGSKFISSFKGDYVDQMQAPDKNYYIKCDLANWNCFMISKHIVKRVGMISDRYEHAMGDFDYSFRMRKAGYPIVIAKDYVGYCENNTIENTFKDSNLSRKKRIKKLFAANGLPVKSWFYFTMKYYKHGRIRNFVMPYIKYLFCIFMNKNCT